MYAQLGAFIDVTKRIERRHCPIVLPSLAYIGTTRMLGMRGSRTLGITSSFSGHLCVKLKHSRPRFLLIINRCPEVTIYSRYRGVTLDPSISRFAFVGGQTIHFV